MCFERKAFEKFATKIERFIRLVSELPHLKEAGKRDEWLDHCDVCRKLKNSNRDKVRRCLTHGVHNRQATLPRPGRP